jgi:hypothetical protein
MCIMEINITNFMIAKLTRVPRNKFRNCDMCSSKNYEFYWIDQPTWGLGLEPTKCRHVKPKSGTLREIAMFNDEDENMSRNFLRLSLNWKKLRKKGEKKRRWRQGQKNFWDEAFRFLGVSKFENFPQSEMDVKHCETIFFSSLFSVSNSSVLILAFVSYLGVWFAPCQCHIWCSLPETSYSTNHILHSAFIPHLRTGRWYCSFRPHKVMSHYL